MRRHFASAAACLALLASVPSAAQEQGAAAPECPAVPAPPPPELASWDARVPMKAGIEPGTAKLTIGQAVDATLPRTPEVHYPVRPEQPGGTVSYGGLFAFTVAQAGTYRVALGTGAWIDVVKEGKALESTAHGHGPDCSTVRKMVDFALEPGSYTLQIAASGQAELPLLVTRVP